jgi:hypothetical protein
MKGCRSAEESALGVIMKPEIAAVTHETGQLEVFLRG